MSWMIETEQQRVAREEAERERITRMFREGAEKARARDAFVKHNTCPHCGQCPPLPPWFY